MNNLSFLPENIRSRSQNKKIKLYKTYLLLLWILSLVLFMCLVYYKYRRNELIHNTLSYNQTLNKTLEGQVSNQPQNNTLQALNRFIEDFNNTIPYKTVLINDGQINLEVEIKDKKEYYNLVKYIEGLSDYRIQQISPIVNDGENPISKLQIEVK